MLWASKKKIITLLYKKQNTLNVNLTVTQVSILNNISHSIFIFLSSWQTANDYYDW